MNIEEIITKALRPTERPYDGLLHASMDISDNLRHVMLRYVNAPTVQRHHLGLTKATTGTLWHQYLGDRLTELGILYSKEIPLRDYLPEGWSGTADFLLFGDPFGSVLLDLKTTSERAMPFIPKEEHVLQVSSYWAALRNVPGLELDHKFGIIYLPLDTMQTRSNSSSNFEIKWIAPVENVWEVMEARYRLVEEYHHEFAQTGDILNKYLAPVQPRVQKLFKREAQYDLKFVPHWSSDYCPFPTDLCDCSTVRGETKIGHYRQEDDAWVYVPRKGYANIKPDLTPERK